MSVDWMYVEEGVKKRGNVLIYEVNFVEQSVEVILNQYIIISYYLSSLPCINIF